MSDSSRTKFINAKRRGFLQGAAVASGAVASGAAVSGAVISAEDLTKEVAPAAPKNKGYEKNAYVERYYARARF